MDKQEFSSVRKSLGKTQKEMGQLLGVSVRAIHGYEQGWRRVPGHVERQVFFLVSRIENHRKPCWIIRKCPPELKKRCPAWEFRAGDLCWFINGTICAGEPHSDWADKMKLCRKCDVFQPLLSFGHPTEI